MPESRSVRKALFYDSTSGEVELKETSESEVFVVLNQRWTLLVLRALCEGPVRFNELAKTSGLNPNTLRDRLRDLERIGIVGRTVLSTVPPKVEYRLAGDGAELIELFQKFNGWLSNYAVVYEANKSAYADAAARPSGSIG